MKTNCHSRSDYHQFFPVGRCVALNYSGHPQKMHRIIKEYACLWDNKISILLYEKISCLYSDNRI